MIIFIKDVEIGSFDWSAKPEDKIIDFWITAQLTSGRIIKIFIGPFEERIYKIKKFVNQRIECLLSARISTTFISKYRDHNNFEGVYLGEYEISPLWKSYIKNVSDEGYCGIETVDGEMLIWCETYKDMNLNKKETYRFNVKEFGIIAWYPLEE